MFLKFVTTHKKRRRKMENFILLHLEDLKMSTIAFRVEECVLWNLRNFLISISEVSSENETERRCDVNVKCCYPPKNTPTHHHITHFTHCATLFLPSLVQWNVITHSTVEVALKGFFCSQFLLFNWKIKMRHDKKKLFHQQRCSSSSSST